MKEKSGIPFSIGNDNPPVKGCTVSKEIYHKDNLAITIFSLDEGTDISAESYEYPKLLIVAAGEVVLYTKSWRETLSAGQCITTPTYIPVGIEAKTKAVYTEIILRRDTKMNNAIESGKVFSLAELVPYQDGKIVNMDIIRDPKIKFVVMSFDEGTGLSEHAAPGEALIFALDGEGIIGYEGKEYHLHAGENFKFAKNGKHWVKANGRFKMALLLTLE